MNDQPSSDMPETCNHTSTQQESLSFSSTDPKECSPSPVDLIPAIIEGQSLLQDQPYDPRLFRSWIQDGITKARKSFHDIPDSSRTEEMKINRRIFECLDAATEKDLNRIPTKESALELLEKVNWTDLMGGGTSFPRGRSENKMRSGLGERFQGFGNYEQMKAEKSRLKRQRAADEAGAKQIKLMDSRWRVEEKERGEKYAKEARERDRDEDLFFKNQ